MTKIIQLGGEVESASQKARILPGPVQVRELASQRGLRARRLDLLPDWCLWAIIFGGSALAFVIPFALGMLTHHLLMEN